MKSDFLCNWCGGKKFSNPDNIPLDQFELAIFGKVDLSNIECASCGSKPRQRCLKQVLDENKTSNWKNLEALQLSPDLLPLISDWFNSVEVSIFEGENSIDLENANRPDSSYDIIVCSHILEHIKNDVKAVQELIRMLKSNGQVYIMVPQPVLNTITRDWGYPDENDHGHYRMYGRDFKDKLKSIVQESASLTVFEKIDTFTRKKEFIYVLTKNELLSNHNNV